MMIPKISKILSYTFNLKKKKVIIKNNKSKDNHIIDFYV